MILYQDTNYNFFKQINSEESAYFLGLLYADGCVSINKSNYTVYLKLQNQDVEIIEKFRNIMSPSSPIKNTGKYSYFRINKKEICEQLISHGCIPNKSLTLQFPTTVPVNLYRHFIRGYSDGDGSIYNNKLKYSINTIWKIVSTEQFCNSIKNILRQELDINCGIYMFKNKVTASLVVGGNKQVKKGLDWIYEGATIYLSRKYNKYSLLK